MSLERLRKPDALRSSRRAAWRPRCRPSTASSPDDEIAALAQWIYSRSSPAPRWAESDIRASRVQQAGCRRGCRTRPVWSADPMNLFVVVEGGDHHVTLLDGDRFEPIHRFESRFALHGGPSSRPTAASSSSVRATAGSPGYDLWNLVVVAEVRAGLNGAQRRGQRRRQSG